MKVSNGSSSSWHTRLPVLLSLMTLLAVAVFVWFFKFASDYQNIVAATVLAQPRQLPPFELIDSQGEPFTNARLQHQWTLLFFGFTQCHYICPMTMSILKQVYHDLAQQLDTNELPHVVMISVDPERDTLSRLNQYVTAFDASFIGATGSNVAVKQLAKDVGVAYNQGIKQDISDYQIEHSGALLLVDPQGQLVAVFTQPHHTADIVSDYKQIVE